MRTQRALGIFASILLTAALNAQEMTPVVHTWSKKDHNAANQIWSASCSPDGIMYFGNANGLLSFDSKEWVLHPFKGSGFIRSTLCDGGRIYVGAYEEFGYFEPDECCQLRYVSLSDRLDGFEMYNDEIWTILKLDNRILFHSFVNCFVYDCETQLVSALPLNSFTESVGVSASGELLCSAYGFAKMDIQTGELAPLPHPWKGRMVASLVPDTKTTIIVTENEGLFLMDGNGLTEWKTEIDIKQINRALLCSNGNIILGSRVSGCCAIDAQGRRLWTVDASNVLNSNTVLSICENREGDIFLAMDSGIAIIDNNTGIRYISSLDANVGSIYCSFYKSPYLYIGSNQGLYIGRINGSSLVDVARVKDIKGPVMYLKEFDSQLFCGTNAETFCIEGRKAVPVSRGNAGGSCLAIGLINGEEVLIEGTYTKLCLYKKDNGRWKFSHRIDGFIQPVGSIDIDYMGNIWAGHNTKGLYRLRLDSDLRTVRDVRFYGSLSPKAQLSKIKVSKIKGRTVFVDPDTIYTYDDMTDSTIVYKYLNDRTSGIRNILDISHYKQDKYWVLNEDDAYILDCSDHPQEDVRLSYNIFNSNTVDQYKSISSGPGGMSIISLNNSLAFVPDDFARSAEDWKPELKLVSVGISENDGSQFKYLPLNGRLSWNYSSTLVKFRYSYPFFAENGSHNLEYRLKGRDEVWRECVGDEIDLSHLKEGHYSLEVRVVNKSGQQLDLVNTGFRIKPPFVRSVPMKILYILLIIGTISLIIISVRRKILAQRQELENRRLESELQSKSREIAMTTMSLLNKNKILQDIKEELSVQKNELGAAYPDKYYRKMISAIDSQISSEDDWKLFQENFDRIHGNFFQILKSRYPSLTDSDLRFCSYFCMAMSSKEIASMMNISLKGVEAARYRIRKKLQLPSEISLTSFLMDLK
ncbi:MAG: hypothetical protein ACI3Y4_04470 [Candidatus Cryptobacteroides sp.]